MNVDPSEPQELVTTLASWKDMLKETGREEFVFNLRDMTEAQIAVPAMPVPVVGVINGERIPIGEGTINPETMIFTTRLYDTPAAKAFLDEAEKRGAEGEWGTGYIAVSEVTFKLVVETESDGD